MCDILIIGSGYFAEVMIADLAATARMPLRVVLGGRNAARLDWLSTAGNSRAANFGTAVSFTPQILDSTSAETLAPAMATLKPGIVVLSASIQSPWKVDNLDSDWALLVNRAGFGVTIAFHALLASRAARAVRMAVPDASFVNTCYPDGVNPLLHAAGLPITCGVGNISIFSTVVAGRLPLEDRARLRVLAHHQHLVEWRKPGAQRGGTPVRAWMGDAPIPDVDALTRDIQLPYRDLNLISGAGAVPVLRALAGEGAALCHVPGPAGLPGGYPVWVDKGRVTLDLPKGVARDEAIAWNRTFEDADGVGISDGRVTYAPRAREALAAISPELADGFAVGDVEQAAAALGTLRQTLGG
ncbi:hypothetical protein ACQW02_15730 [Humitalea sp. 24SJ18S-53]|uniref:hypothetical protein n=1 Tax=Humitalea sp. 24SJ18S-53 TaxID=3422307 RepID=UPI003D66A22C